MNKELEKSHIDYLDAAFLGTMESQGYNNAKKAIKLCLLNDTSVLKGEMIDYSKWLLISNKYDGRKKIKKIQTDDIAHILIKYALATFAKKGEAFSVTEEDYIKHRQNPLLSEGITGLQACEILAYAAFNDLYNAYILVLTNNNICGAIMDSLIENRYMNMLIEEYDNFDGKIKNPSLPTEFKYMYYDKYKNIDKDFAALKQENINYATDVV